MKAMAVVAHPDDCVIFAYSYIYNHPEYSWTICYLTYTDDHPRAKEFCTFWKKRNISVVFLGFKEQWNHEKNCPGDLDVVEVKKAIQKIIADQDLILSHNSKGEYGHPHHVMVHHSVANHHNLVTFADPGKGTIKYSVKTGAYSLDELPLHRDIISGFHTINHINEYTICKNI